MSFKTFQSALSTILSALVLAIAVAILWIYLDEQFREKAVGWLGDQYLGAVIEESSKYKSVNAKLLETQNQLATANDNSALLAQTITRLLDTVAAGEQIKGELDSLKEQHKKTRDALNTAEARVAAEKLQLENAFNELHEKLDDAQRSSKVEIERLRDNLTIIRVGDKVLFDSGHAVLKSTGKEVLLLIAKTLNQFADRQVRIQGHSDNKPIKSEKTLARFASNWELSSARAVAALRFLEEQGDVSSNRLSAVGYGAHRPVADNDSQNGRTRNRRIEIVLMPAANSYRVKDLD